MLNMEKTGLLLKQAVNDSPYSTKEICDIMGLSTTAVYSWFRGETIPSIDNLFLFAEILDRKVDELISYEPMYARSRKIA